MSVSRFYQWHIPFILALIFTLVVGFALGLLTEHLFLGPMVGEPVLSVIMVTVGLSFFFKGVVELIWGTDTVVFTPKVFPMEPIFIGKIVVGQVYLWAFVACDHPSGRLCGFLQIYQMGFVHAGNG